MGECCDAALRRIRRLVSAGERSPRTIEDYLRAAAALTPAIPRETPVDSLRPAHFARLRATLSDRYSLATLKNRVGMIRTILDAAGEIRDDNGDPRWSGRVDYGQEFDRPGSKAIRKQRSTKPARLFTADEVRRLLAVAREPVRTFVLLALNCGYGNQDVADLVPACLVNRHGEPDLEDPSWITLIRGKTGTARRCPLWPETIEALRPFTTGREATDTNLLFVTAHGNAWVRVNPDPDESENSRVDSLSRKFKHQLSRAKIKSQQRGFYALRHCFATWAADAKDPLAVKAVMGHVDGSMTGQYTHGVSDERLRAVVDAVRARVF